MTGEYLVKETFNHVELFVHIPDSHNHFEECRNNLNQIKQKVMQWRKNPRTSGCNIDAKSKPKQ
jgi:hypothetical protein